MRVSEQRHDRQPQDRAENDGVAAAEALRQRTENQAADDGADVVDNRDPAGGRGGQPGPLVGGRGQEGGVDVLGAVAHPVERGHQQHQVKEPADDRGAAQHVTNSGLGEPHPVLRGFPHLGFLHPVADDQADQSRDDGKTEQPAPRQAQPVHNQQAGQGGQQIAECVALLQQPGEEPAPADGHLLHRQRGTQPPLAAHPDAIQQAQDHQYGEVRREGAQESDHRIQHHVDHERNAPADAIGPQPEQQRTHRAHRQSGRRDECDFSLGVVEGFCDVGVDQHHDEVVEGVHRPAQERRNERVSLVDGQPRCRHVSIVQHGGHPANVGVGRARE